MKDDRDKQSPLQVHQMRWKFQLERSARRLNLVFAIRVGWSHQEKELYVVHQMIPLDLLHHNFAVESQVLPNQNFSRSQSAWRAQSDPDKEPVKLPGCNLAFR